MSHNSKVECGVHLHGIGKVEGLDAGITGFLQHVNKAGYHTHFSCSGLFGDHWLRFNREQFLASLQGFVCFNCLSDRKICAIKDAARTAGFSVFDGAQSRLRVYAPMHPDAALNMARWSEEAAIKAGSGGCTRELRYVRARYYRALRQSLRRAWSFLQEECDAWVIQQWKLFEKAMKI